MELERVFEQTMEVLARELKMRRGTLVLLDKVTNELRIVAAHGLNREEKKRGRYRVGEGVTGKVVQTGQPMAIADISKDPLFLNRTGARAGEKARGRISFVCVPLRIDAEVVGAISVDRDFVDEETLARDQRLLQIIASLVSQAIRINRMVMVEREQLLAENLRLRKDLRLRYKLGNIVAASGAMQDVVATAATVAKSNATVLIRGETGTGKELVASVLHYNSGRANGPFVKVNCGALPETLLETELFGHVRGAFTGAVEDRKGRFELAHKGTVFLDEVSNMSERLQVKLLRVLQEREFERVGGTETIKADVRVVAATNADLEEQVAKGTFREDLFYRLNVIPIFIPPLRERREDIPFLVEHFLEKYNRECGKSISKMSQEVLDALTEYPWPGNVRELESCIERAVVLSQSGTISMNLLPINIRSFKEGAKAKEYVGAPEEVVSSLVEKLRRERRGILSGVHGRIIARVEKALLEKVLQDTNYVQTRAAKELGLSRNTLRKKMEEYGILSK
jgi:Nif-specific regulatory protein